MPSGNGIANTAPAATVDLSNYCKGNHIPIQWDIPFPLAGNIWHATVAANPSSMFLVSPETMQQYGLLMTQDAAANALQANAFGMGGVGDVWASWMAGGYKFGIYSPSSGQSGVMEIFGDVGQYHSVWYTARSGFFRYVASNLPYASGIPSGTTITTSYFYNGVKKTGSGVVPFINGQSVLMYPICEMVSSGYFEYPEPNGGFEGN